MAARSTRNDAAAHGWSWRSPAAFRSLLLVLLAFASGYIDAVSYLGLGGVFTSNMTGNTVLLGLALGQAKRLAALRSLVALAGFLGGVVLGSVITDRTPRRAIWPAAVTGAFALEFVVLLVFTVWGGTAGTTSDGPVIYALIALSAIAMGIQSVAVRALRVSGVTTTYITGTWTSLVGDLANRVRAARSGGAKPRPATEPLSSAGLQAAVVCVYLVAAVAGGAAEIKWLLAAAAVPTTIVFLVVALALARFRRGASDGGV